MAYEAFTPRTNGAETKGAGAGAGAASTAGAGAGAGAAVEASSLLPPPPQAASAAQEKSIASRVLDFFIMESFEFVVGPI